ncbi:shikimate dehydrogenase [Arthrobacter sp. NPDC093125]|jgi:shikimate dehydrogenase|uniref:shikimate dehydrogenase n=1 Tax=Arthrobacter sp. NPDC093125 TaxID=3363944 RepID=UPI003814E099
MNRRAAVLGHPISHSKSPALHLAAYARLGEDIGYSAIDVTEEGLPAFMATARGQEGWRGLSVTMPLKTAMVREVDEVRGVGRVLGVINTVVFEGEGESARRIGYNTDVTGIVNALRNAGAVQAPAAVVLGGGGTAAAAVAALQELGAQSVDVFVRNTGRAAEARAAARGLAMDIAVHPMRGAVDAMAAADVVISTLPPRAADGMAADLEQLGGATDGILLDVAYDPWPSRIAAAWQQGGGTVVPGLEMLLYQAVEQVRYFTGREDAASADVIDVMCIAVGAPRRVL